jgi:hypothetical protein
MTANKNGWLEIGPLGSPPDNVSGALIGSVAGPISNLAIQIPLRVSLAPLKFIDDFEFQPVIVFYEEIRDTNPSSPNLGQLISRNPILNQPTVGYTGSFYEVTKDDDESGINPHRFYYEPPWVPVFPDLIGVESVFNRKTSVGPVSYTVTAHIQFTGELPAGNYQGDFIVMHNGNMDGKIIINLSITDANKLFDGPPTTVWYHHT